MASTGLNGPHTLDSETVEKTVTKTSPGNYALGRVKDDGKFYVNYVGRADKDLATRLKQHAGKYERFKYGYATSPKAAFEKECQLFHDFEPPANKIHPDRPDNTNWECPVCDLFD